jgi:hypothetical protein
VAVTGQFLVAADKQSQPISIGSRRAVHLRTDDPSSMGGLHLRRGVPYGFVLESSGDLWIQYSRLDTTQAAYSLMTAILDAS